MTRTPATYWEEDVEDLADHLMAHTHDPATPTVFAVIGAGNIARLIPGFRTKLVRAYMEQREATVAQRCPRLPMTRSRPWSRLTSAGVGSACPLFAEPVDRTELRELLAVASQHALPILPIGAGTNTVGDDRDEPQMIVRLRKGVFGEIKREDRTLRVGAGVSLRGACESLARENALPEAAAALAWIPGSIGGAVRMNAGADGADIADIVARVRGITGTGEDWDRPASAITWGYRRTDIPEDVVVTDVWLRAVVTEKTKTVQAALRNTLAQRQARQPKGRSAGCTFRNAGQTSAGSLLDKAGCKGMREGGCRISSKHANFIVCTPDTTADDVETLILRARERVMQHTGVRLREEVVFADPEARRRVANALPAKTVAVLKGGASCERDVSLVSGAEVARALREAGYRVFEVELTANELPPLPPETDVVFPALHGSFGEDGQVQKLLETHGMPYVGSDAVASRLIISKRLTKQRLEEAGIPTPRYRMIESPDAPFPYDLRPPLIVKPDAQGSTVGVTRLNGPSGWWRRALNKAFAVDRRVLVEEYITGPEITVGVLNGDPLPVVEIVPPKGRIYDADAKYTHRRGHTHYFCPPENVAVQTQTRAQEIAVRTYELLEADDMLRVDFMVDDRGIPQVLEANSIPGFTPLSLLPKAAAAAGLTFPELCARLVARQTGVKRHDQHTSDTSKPAQEREDTS